jgi:hypothetical protein
MTAQPKRPPHVAPLEAPPVLPDLVYFDQIIKVILSSITRTTSSTNRETTIPWSTAYRIRRIQVICFFFRDEDAKVTSQWLQKIKELFTWILVPEEVRVNCMA